MRTSPAFTLPALALLFALGGLAGLGCSSSDDDSSDGSATRDAGGGDGSVITVGQADGSTDLSPAQAACYALQQQVQGSLTAAANAASNSSCSTDTDCVTFSNPGTCSVNCGFVTSNAGAASYQAALTASESSAACTQFVADKCGLLEPPCYDIGPGAQCLAGTCVAGVPADWTSLTLEADMNGSGTSLPAACSGTDCTLWVVTPDATITTQISGRTVTAMLSSADFSTLDGLLRDTAFRQGETMGFACTGAPGTEHVTETVARRGVSNGEDVSDCLSGGASPGSDWQTIYAVLQKY